MRHLIVFFILFACGLLAYSQNVGIGIATPQSKLHIRPNSAAAVQIDPYGSAAGETGDLRFIELPGAGTNFVGFKAADNITANVVWTLPAFDGSGTQVLSTDGAANLYWQNLPSGGSSTTPANCYTCDGF